MDTTTKHSTMEDVLKTLENENQLDSLFYLVQKLPDFVSRIQALDDKLTFIEDVLEDKQSMSAIGDEVEQKIANLHLNQEHFSALLEMVHLTPRIVPALKRVDEMTQFLNDFFTDTASVEYALESINDIVPLNKAMDVMKETNEQFKNNQNTTNLSLYGMYRLLKDPTIQKGFQYLEIFLEVVNKEK